MLFGLALGVWAVLVAAGLVAYGFLMVSPLPWRVNVSVVVIGLGAPVSLLALREGSAIGPGRLLLAAVRWRTRPSVLLAVTAERPVRGGAVLLDRPPGSDRADAVAAAPDRGDR